MENENGYRCDECGKEIKHRSVHLTDSDGNSGRLLCLECYNREMAAIADIHFEHPTFPTVLLADVDGDEHRFDFAVQLFGYQVSIEAYELEVEHGYRFEIGGNPEKVQKLFNKLLGKMRRALSRKHIEVDEYGGMPGMLDEMEARGWIEWDDGSHGQLPLLVIDGKPVTWHQFGRILSSYEDWQFKLEIKERIDEV